MTVTAVITGRLGRHWKGLYRNTRLREELKRLILSIVWFGVCAFSMAIVQINGDALHAKFVRPSILALSAASQTANLVLIPPIYDMAFESLPRISSNSLFNPDVLLHSFILVSIAAGIIHWPPLVLISRLRRYFWLYGLGYLLRMFTLLGTVLPPSNPLCVPQARSLWETIAMTPALLFGQAHTCTDKLFSGHTTVATLLLWMWLDARCVAGDGPISFWRTYSIVHFFGMIISSILGLNHYTVDIVLAAIINTFTYHGYKFAIVIKQQFNHGGGNPLTEEWKTIPEWLINLISWCDGVDIAARILEQVDNDGTINDAVPIV